jgi:hypothetical protein
MSTIDEIEAAIEGLPKHQMEALARWLSNRLAHGHANERDVNLASLAGTWQEDPAFDAAILAFEQVDEELWR